MKFYKVCSIIISAVFGIMISTTGLFSQDNLFEVSLMPMKARLGLAFSSYEVGAMFNIRLPGQFKIYTLAEASYTRDFWCNLGLGLGYEAVVSTNFSIEPFLIMKYNIKLTDYRFYPDNTYACEGKVRFNWVDDNYKLFFGCGLVYNHYIFSSSSTSTGFINIPIPPLFATILLGQVVFETGVTLKL